jgi:hypothetical protein
MPSGTQSCKHAGAGRPMSSKKEFYAEIRNRTENPGAAG